MEITLEQLLASRDRRQQRQRELLADGDSGLTLLCLTVVMPGPQKRNELSLTVAQAAVTELLRQLLGSLVYHETADLPTGFEGYFLVRQPLADAKRLACRIEDTHPLGRLFDIDAIGSDGVPLDRQSIGLPSRRCLICGGDAHACMRNRTHPLPDLLHHIKLMVDAYVRHNRN